MFHFKNSSDGDMPYVAFTDYIVSPERDSSSLKNHYLLKHPATFIVSGIGLALLLIMMASLPKDTAKMLEETALTPKISEKAEKKTLVLNSIVIPSPLKTTYHGPSRS